MNEFSEIISAMEHTRSGRTLKANVELQELINERNGFYIESSLNERSIGVPMNWTLSHNALSRIERFCAKEAERLNSELSKF